jgi:predicted Zn-dependent peptidase
VQFHETKLDNGLQLIGKINPQAHSVAVGFFVQTGSRDESLEEAGVSHFLEHMVFKGTARRDSLAVNLDLDKIGAKHNAQTSEEDTIYHVTCLPEHLPRALEILADILRPSLRDEDFRTEKKVILEEIQMHLDNPLSVAYEHAMGAHYSEHPLGHSILGTLDSIGGLEVKRMREYFAHRYVPSNMVLAIAGNTEWARFVELANAACGTWSDGAATRPTLPVRSRPALETIERADDQQQTTVAIGDAPPVESDCRYAALLLATILGDATGSRLYWALVDPGLADSADLSYHDFHGAGAFFTVLTCEPSEAEQNLGRIAAIYRAMKAERPTGEELVQAQNKVMGRLVLRNDRAFWRMMTIGSHWTGRREYLSVDDELDAISRVTLDDIREVLERWPPEMRTIVSVGPCTRIKQPRD